MIYPDAGTADRYAAIFADLREHGRMMPVNDLRIAAITIQHELTLCTRDQHFEAVVGLSITEASSGDGHA